jgi:hypothetical protein
MNMQKIRSFLKISNSGAVLCDDFGSDTGITLEFTLGTGILLEFELHTTAVGESAQLPDYPSDELDFAAGYCAFDLACNNNEYPPLLISSGVTLQKDPAGHSVFTVPLNNSATSGITAAMKGKSQLELLCELGGFNADGNPVFAWQFPVILHNRVYRGSGGDSVIDDPAYFTAVQIQAIAAGLEEKISAISDSHENVTAQTLKITDSGNWFSGESVEDALQEIGGTLAGVDNLLKEI